MKYLYQPSNSPDPTPKVLMATPKEPSADVKDDWSFRTSVFRLRTVASARR
jgi:hypothetical protein